jgi:hypothetical protein
MNNLAPQSVTALFETTKAERKTFVEGLVNSIEAGEVDALKIHLQIKAMEDIIKQLTSSDATNQSAQKYRSMLLAEAEKHNQKEFEINNAKISIRETGVDYDYRVCGDEVLNKLLSTKEQIDNEVRERRAWLNNVPSTGVSIVDKDTGEVSTIYPPAKTSTTTVVVSLK